MTTIEPISIVTIMRNSADWIGGFLSLVAQQANPPVQVILVDAQSTDRSVVTACEMAEIHDVLPVADGHLGMTQIRVVRMESRPDAEHYNAAFGLLHDAAAAVAIVRPTTCLYPFFLDAVHAGFDTDDAIVAVYSDFDMRYPDGSFGRQYLQSFDARKILDEPLLCRELVVRRDALQRLIGMDPAIQRPEYDFILQASELGLCYHIPRSLMETEHTTPIDAESHRLALQKVRARRGQDA